MTFLFNHHFSGGVENCGPKVFQKEYTFVEGSKSVEVTLCGHPQPELQYTFKGKTKEAEMIEKLDDSKKMYKYKIKDWYNSSSIKIKCKNLTTCFI